MKKSIRKMIPESFVLFFHFLTAKCAAFYYGYPSRKMIVIGVTGTKGKTSTVNFVWSALSSGGFKTGAISSANIRIGSSETLNNYHMTMPGRFEMQRNLAKMAQEGCKYCVVEVSSEGIKQSRHVGINFDILIFTNLTPEHLPSHGGSFEKYKQAKGKLFAALNSRTKNINGEKVEKIIIANKDSDQVNYFLGFSSDRKITFSIEKDSDYRGKSIQENDRGVTFSVNQEVFQVKILGRFNVYNALPAIAIAESFGIDATTINRGFQKLLSIPGRMEKIDLGQNFTLIVDYAHEKQSMTKLLQAANVIRRKENKTIVLLGAEGGGRDKSKRAAMGEISAQMADYVVISNVDPYDDNPMEIIEEIAQASERNGKTKNKNLFLIEDRRAGIAKALSLAEPGDIVLITGKGSEQSMVISGNKIPWDDRAVVSRELENMLKK